MTEPLDPKNVEERMTPEDEDKFEAVLLESYGLKAAEIMANEMYEPCDAAYSGHWKLGHRQGWVEGWIAAVKIRQAYQRRHASAAPTSQQTAAGDNSASDAVQTPPQPEPATADLEGRAFPLKCRAMVPASYRNPPWRICANDQPCREHPTSATDAIEGCATSDSPPPEPLPDCGHDECSVNGCKRESSPARKAAERIARVWTEGNETFSKFVCLGSDVERIITEAHAPLYAELQRLRDPDAEDNATQFKLTDELAYAKARISFLLTQFEDFKALAFDYDGTTWRAKVVIQTARIATLEQDREVLRREVERLRDERGIEALAQKIQRSLCGYEGEPGRIREREILSLLRHHFGQATVATAPAAPRTISPEVRESVVVAIKSSVRYGEVSPDGVAYNRGAETLTDRIIQLLGFRTVRRVTSCGSLRASDFPAVDEPGGGKVGK